MKIKGVTVSQVHVFMFDPFKHDKSVHPPAFKDGLKSIVQQNNIIFLSELSDIRTEVQLFALDVENLLLW